MGKGKKNLQRIIFAVLFIFYYGALFVGYPCIANASPALFMEKKVYDFGTILEGTQIPHDFIIENRGDYPLKILKVKSTCGCAVASYTEEILPGQSGKITVNFDSKGYGGEDVDHKIRVETNATTQGSFDLAMKGHVDALVVIDPKRVFLKGDAGTDIEKEVTIAPDPRKPLKILSAEPRIGKDITCSFKEVKGSKPIKYLLTVKNIRKEKGKYRDYVYLKTDSDIRPGISIKVKGEIR